MAKLITATWLLLAGLAGLLLAGCDLLRPSNQAADIAPPVVAAQNPALIRLDPASRQINEGEITTIQIRLESVVDLTEVNFQLRFTPGVIEVQDANAGEDGVQIQPGDFFDADYVGTNQVDNGAGIINYNALPESTSGSGLLATIIFQAVAPGSSSLTFSTAEIATGGESLEPVSSQPGTIIVNQVAGQPSPVFTPTPGLVTLTPTPGLVALPSDTPTPIVIIQQPTATPTLTPQPTVTNTPGVPQVQIPPGATLGFCYRVQPEDTLYSLAQSYGTDPGFISLANDLYPPGHIYPQQVLFMPTAYGNGPNVYAVQAGDTLALIAERCQLKVDLLAVVNGLQVDTNLSGIEKLIIPRPPFAPPSRYGYPQVGPPSVWPPPCSGPCN